MAGPGAFPGAGPLGMAESKGTKNLDERKEEE